MTSANIKEIMKEVNIQITFEEISKMSRNIFKSIVKSNIEKLAFSYLKAIQQQKEKRKLVKYNTLSLQPYLRSKENLNLNEQQELFAFRCQMNNIKANFCSRNQIKNCNECLNGMDKYHMFQCTWKFDNKNYIYDMNKFKMAQLLNTRLE